MAADLSQETPAVLETVSSFLTAMSGEPPLDAARTLTLDTGFHFVASHSFGVLQRTLAEAIAQAEEHKTTGKAGPGQFELIQSEPTPEVFVHLKMAAVWGAIRRVAPDGTVPFLSYASFFLVKPEGEGNGGWKVSGFTHSHSPTPGAPLPPLGRELTPEVERLLHFADELFKNRGIDDLGAWAVQNARMVRYRRPSPPQGGLVQEEVEQFAGWAAKLPADTEWRENFKDITVRTAGDIGLAWFQFEVVENGKTTSRGIDILALYWDGNRWLFSGTQTMGTKEE
ncbi:hypothetical protein BX600DRAFT_529520 [Xylariales sp. PMI_506]|nr:hypothetical protein BX600DRAFT_529520 [Xylariales sp. PMI_506]